MAGKLLDKRLRVEHALALAQQASRLSPYRTAKLVQVLARAYWLNGQPEQALDEILPWLLIGIPVVPGLDDWFADMLAEQIQNASDPQQFMVRVQAILVLLPPDSSHVAPLRELIRGSAR